MKRTALLIVLVLVAAAAVKVPFEASLAADRPAMARAAGINVKLREQVGQGFSLALLGGSVEDDRPFKGGPYWQAMSYALWEAFVCVGMCIGLIYAFRRYLNRQGRLAKFLSPNAYIAYIIHAQVITFTALLVRNVDLYPLLKFGVVILIAVPLSFVLGNLIRKLPYTDRVL